MWVWREETTNRTTEQLLKLHHMHPLNDILQETMLMMNLYQKLRRLGIYAAQKGAPT